MLNMNNMSTVITVNKIPSAFVTSLMFGYNVAIFLDCVMPVFLKKKIDLLHRLSCALTDQIFNNCKPVITDTDVLKFIPYPQN